MQLKTSALITRKQLACLTGGNVDGVKHKNTLKVGTPITYCGGGALGVKQGTLHHMCLKEYQNHPLPESIADDFWVYKRGMKGGNVNCVHVLAQQTNPIPIFWEPASQEGKSHVDGMKANGVVYVGHWEIIEVENCIENTFRYKGSERIAKICMRYHFYSDRWSSVIDVCQDKTPKAILSLNFSHLSPEVKVRYYIFKVE
jgi:hypothetical protein